MSVQASAQGGQLIATGVRILLVEDNDELREGIAEYLRYNDMEVSEADCGAAFRAAMRRQSFDVVILDVNLPDATGFDLAASISRDDGPPGVIMLTARTSQTDRIRAYGEGADLYMPKPVAGEELVLAVSNLVRRIRGRPPPAPAASGTGSGGTGWQLDMTLGRLVAPNGAIIALSGRETMLLEQFARAGGAPIPRPVLADIMGYGAPSAHKRGLDAALQRLKAKATEQGIELPLVGIQNIGIRFIAPLVTA